MPEPLIQPELLPPGASRPREYAGRLRPRFGGAGGAFRNENLDLLSRVLDTWFRVPGTNIRFGLDGIVGFLPGIGDFLGGAASTIIVLAAFFRGVPLITVGRMVVNLGVEVVVGAVPVLGNLFDIGWRANRRNYALLEASLADRRRSTASDWFIMVILGLGVMALMMLPFALMVWLSGSLLHRMHLRGW